MQNYLPFPSQLSAISDSNDLTGAVPPMATSPPSSSGPAAASGSAGVDRPHTISSAYEKGGAHQRPQLTPYTFEQPTIPENGTAIVRGIMAWREI